MSSKKNKEMIMLAASKTQNQEVIAFLEFMAQGKRDEQTYDLFVRDGARNVVNFEDPDAVRAPFEKVHTPAGYSSEKLWEPAIADAIQVFNGNILPKANELLKSRSSES